VGPTVLEALRRRQVVASTESHKSPFCFTTAVGTLMRRSNLRRSHFSNNDEPCDRFRFVSGDRRYPSRSWLYKNDNGAI